MFEVEEDVAFQSLTVKNMSEGSSSAATFAKLASLHVFRQVLLSRYRLGRANSLAECVKQDPSKGH